MLLAASGACGKDIATRLVLLARTVETHLARVYRKLGISMPTSSGRPRAPGDDRSVTAEVVEL